jgi:hypothetical protein
VNRFQRRPNSAGRFLSKKEMDDALRPVLALAQRHGIPVAIIGGYAMAAHGSPRLTSDVDVAATEPIPGLKPTKRLTFGGFVTRVKGVTVDVVVRQDAFADLYEEAILAARGGVALPEHLVAMKLVAGRPRDQDDLIFLLESGAVNLNKARGVVKRWLGHFGLESLESYILEAEWRRVSETKGSPRRGRGGRRRR